LRRGSCPRSLPLSTPKHFRRKRLLLDARTICGPRLNLLLDTVPYPDFVTASTHVIDNLLTDLEDETRNVLLTLAPVWSTLEIGTIRSKPAAAAWAIDHLPPTHRPVIHEARAICLVEIDRDRWGDLQEINQTLRRSYGDENQCHNDSV